MSAAEKSAVIILALGESLGAEMLRLLDPPTARKIAQSLSRLERIDQETIDQVLVEFHDHVVQTKPLIKQGPDTVRGLLRKALGEDQLAEFDGIIDFATPSLIATLADIDAKALGRFLSKEHPQTIALTLAHLDAKKAGEVVKLLPPSFHFEVMQRLAHLGPVTSEVISDLEDSIKQEMSKESARTSRRDLGGAQKLASMISSLDKENAENLLKELDARNPELCSEVKSLMFRLVDLVRIDVKGLQELLKIVPRATLILALKSCPEAVSSKIKSALSERAVKLLEDDVQSLGQTRKSEVERAQQEITRLARNLIEEGRIQLISSEETYV